MKIIFEKLETTANEISVSFDGGNTYRKYNVAEAKINGITFNSSDCNDLSKIRIKGKSKLLSDIEIRKVYNIESSNISIIEGEPASGTQFDFVRYLYVIGEPYEWQDQDYSTDFWKKGYHLGFYNKNDGYYYSYLPVRNDTDITLFDIALFYVADNFVFQTTHSESYDDFNTGIINGVEYITSICPLTDIIAADEYSYLPDFINPDDNYEEDNYEEDNN